MRKSARMQICHSEKSSGGGKAKPAARPGLFQRVGNFGRRLIGR